MLSMRQPASRKLGFTVASLFTFAFTTAAQQAPPPRPSSPPPLPPSERPAPAPVERLGPHSLRVGNVRIDTAKREVSVAGVVNEVTAIEFIAVAKGGFKAYESVLELETTAVNFNVALILIGLDRAGGYVPQRVGDGTVPKGDPVELWVEWDDAGKPRRVRAEQLVYTTKTNQTLSEGPWVYTGSTFLKDSGMYMAELDGTLIGFIHRDSPIIESPRPFTPDYLANRINPNLKLQPGTKVTLTVRALPTK
jgi:hypothetical protein